MRTKKWLSNARLMVEYEIWSNEPDEVEIEEEIVYVDRWTGREYWGVKTPDEYELLYHGDSSLTLY